MYRFALRPRWLLSHLLVVLLLVAMVSLGFWQLRRLDDRRQRNEVVAARTQQPAAPVDEVVASAEAVEDTRYRPATATGVFEPDGGHLVDNRSLDGRPGAWVLTPMRLPDGSVLVVNRGFVATSGGGQVAVPAPPRGTVTVGGTLESWTGRRCGIRTGDDGDLQGAACLSRPAAEAAAGTSVLPVVLRADPAVPGDAALTAVPLPEPGEGPHLGYAVQWFIFATIGAVGYPLILRKNARERAGGAAASAT